MRSPILLVLVVCGASCGAEPARPVRTSPVSVKQPPPPPVDAVIAPAQVTATIVEGTPTVLPDGLELEVSKILYAHLKGDQNLSMAEVTVTYKDRTDSATLERGPNTPGLTFVEIAGVKVALEGVDAYGKPPSAFVVVVR